MEEEESLAVKVTKILKNIKNNIKHWKSEDQTILCNNGKLIPISSNNFDKTCRSCLLGIATKNLFNSEHEGRSLSDIFLALYSIEVKECDGLPSSLCEDCFEAVLVIYTFRASVIKSEEILKDIVTKDNPVTFRESVIKSEEISMKSAEIVKDIVTKDNLISHQINAKHCTKAETKEERRSNSEAQSIFYDRSSEHKEKKAKPNKHIYKCKHCNLAFDKFQDHRKHYREERGRKKDQHERLKSGIPLRKLCHKKEKPETKLQCETCGKKYSTARNLKRHGLSHTGLPHVCQICGRGFRESHLLKEHLNIHSGECPYLCSLCGKNYPTTGALRLHRRYKHEGKKPKVYPKKPTDASKPKLKGSFPCEICGKVYASKTIVNYHVLTHSEEKKFQCNDCGKLFANKGTLGDHRRVHRLSYKCHLCERTFAYAASLETHVNSHTGDKPHVCSVCGKRYSNRSHMREHMRNHTGERPYACNICRKTFAVKGILNTHLKTHAKEEGINYICSMCPRVFVKEVSLNEHMKNDHSNSFFNPPVTATEC